MSDDLVERAKESIAVGCGCDRWCETAGECSCEADAKRVIAMTLEEAAKVCDAIEDKLHEQWRANYKVCDYTQGASDGANDCAAAIRALKGTK